MSVVTEATKRRLPKITRDTILFSTGLVLTINELVFRSGEQRQYVLVLLAGMMGLPAFLHFDEKRRNSNDDESKG